MRPSLEEVMVNLRRLNRWKFADAAQIETGAGHRLEFAFYLDLSQLPRPLQMGAAGQGVGVLAVEGEHAVKADQSRGLAPDQDPDDGLPFKAEIRPGHKLSTHIAVGAFFIQAKNAPGNPTVTGLN